MKRIIRLALILTLPFFLWFCSSKVLAPTTSQVQNVVENYPGMDSTNINQGYLIFSESCNQCHKLKQASRYSDEDWHKILPVMSKKAELTKEETEKVEAYVLAFSKDKKAAMEENPK